MFHLTSSASSENSARIASALARLGLRGFASDSFTKCGLQVPLKQTFYAELLTPILGGEHFDAIEGAATQGKLFGLPVRIASVPALILMKRLASESQPEQSGKHLRDIALLERAVA